MNERERALDHKCPSCGGKCVFEPKIGKWKCEYCKSEFDLDTLQKHNNASSEENNKETDKDVDTSYVEYHCKNCGAKIVADVQTALDVLYDKTESIQPMMSHMCPGCRYLYTTVLKTMVIMVQT